MIAPPTPVPTVTKTISATNGLMKEQLKLRNLPRAFWSAQKHPEAEEIQVFMMVKVVFHDVSSSLAVSASLSSQHASCQPQLLSKPGANKLETYGKTTGKKQLSNKINIRISRIKMINQLSGCCYQFLLFRRIGFRVYNDRDERQLHFPSLSTTCFSLQPQSASGSDCLLIMNEKLDRKRG